MANINSLKSALRQKAKEKISSRLPLSDTQYSAGFDIFIQDSGRAIYQDFIIPQMVELLKPLFSSRARISVLEIGPGPRSVLGYLPCHLKRKIKRFVAFEPNVVFAAKLEKWLSSNLATEPPFPCLESLPDIHHVPFVLHGNIGGNREGDTRDNGERYDVILFCHSLYGMNPKTKFIERALKMLVEPPEQGLVVVFHRDGKLDLDKFVCHRTACFPTGEIRVQNNDNILDIFASFIAGFVLQDGEGDSATRLEWRTTCQTMSRRTEAQPNSLFFSSPNLMVAFTKHSIALRELATLVPLLERILPVKNWEARLHRPASIVRPTEIQQVQNCVQWALQHKTGLTVVGGGHSAHCLWPHVVAVDMSAFDKIHICPVENGEAEPRLNGLPLIVAEAGCKTGDIIRHAMAAGVTVPLGARPGIGAGLWLQGGLGHLTRLYGLACDAIVGAVIVSVDSSHILCVGNVPRQHCPAAAVRPDNEMEILWALRGAGTNVGIIISVTFKSFPAPTYQVRTWVIPLKDEKDAQLRLRNFEEAFARTLPRHCSADAYLYWQAGKMHLGVTTFESSISACSLMPSPSMAIPGGTTLGPEEISESMDGLDVFEAEMYMFKMHGGHGGGKTSSFKRCVFLNGIGARRSTKVLIEAIGNRPSPLCYVHLLHGGGAVGSVGSDATAFGCRDWDYACVVTGVWSRDHDGSEVARNAVGWVYRVVENLLPLSRGVYGADLGPDPRDAKLSVMAFGSNRQRLVRLKQTVDPFRVLAYTCPLSKEPAAQRLIILVTGESGAGKDHCADVWVSVLTAMTPNHITATSISISDMTKREYAAATGASLDLLLRDRDYKERHRPLLTDFYQNQVRQRPQLPEEHFLNVVHNAAHADVLLITGIRDDTPVATLSHLVPATRVIEVNVRASHKIKKARRGCNATDNGSCSKTVMGPNKGFSGRMSSHQPTFQFDNDEIGDQGARKFAETYLLPFVSEDLHRLAQMVTLVPDFPRPSVEFRHILDICQQPGGLDLCTSLLQSQFIGDWTGVDIIVCCEAGGFVFASALALRVGASLALIREAGKLPPPTISVSRSASHISSSLSVSESKEKNIEIGLDTIPTGASVVVVDDVLATGNTMSAVLQLLDKTNACADVKVLVVAEFPFHCGRNLVKQSGYGGVHVQSLLVFEGV
jgi:adenine phosphoribosyltransferase